MLRALVRPCPWATLPHSVYGCSVNPIDPLIQLSCRGSLDARRSFSSSCESLVVLWLRLQWQPLFPCPSRTSLFLHGIHAAQLVTQFMRRQQKQQPREVHNPAWESRVHNPAGGLRVSNPACGLRVTHCCSGGTHRSGRTACDFVGSHLYCCLFVFGVPSPVTFPDVTNHYLCFLTLLRLTFQELMIFALLDSRGPPRSQTINYFIGFLELAVSMRLRTFHTQRTKKHELTRDRHAQH